MQSQESTSVKVDDAFIRAVVDDAILDLNQALEVAAGNGYTVEIDIKEDFGRIGMAKIQRVTRRIFKEL